MRKYFTAFIGFGFLAIVITVVCLLSFKPIESLLKPPMSGGENHEIQIAFEKSINKSYKLRAPLSGDYRSSYIFEDLDGDLQDEVIVFYSTSDALDIVKMSFLVKENNEWKSIAGFESSYSEIHQIRFADLDKDGVMEVLVGWAVYQNDLSRNLNVYKVPLKNSDNFDMIYSCAYSDFDTADIDNDGDEDIAVFESDSGTGIRLNFNAFENDGIVTKASVLLDSSVYSVLNISQDNSSVIGHTRLFVDGYKIDAGIVTECVYWNKESETLEKFKPKNNTAVLSSRMTNIVCQDVNDNGLIDVPVEVPLNDSKIITENQAGPQIQNIIKWVQFDGDASDTVTQQLIYGNNDFRITFNDEWMKNITVINNYNNNTIYFYSADDDDKKMLFELKYISTQAQEDELTNKYKILTETKKGKLFYVIYNSDRELNINKFFLEKNIVF